MVPAVTPGTSGGGRTTPAASPRRPPGLAATGRSWSWGTSYRGRLRPRSGIPAAQRGSPPAGCWAGRSALMSGARISSPAGPGRTSWSVRVCGVAAP